jgi:hypothetical protein
VAAAADPFAASRQYRWLAAVVLAFLISILLSHFGRWPSPYIKS